MLRKLRENRAVIALLLLTILFTVGFQKFGMKEYARYSTENLHYEKGKVVEVSSNELEYDDTLGIYLGKQELEVEMLEGAQKGGRVTVTNYLTKTHNVLAKKNTTLIINADRPVQAEPYYTVYNYDRTFPEALSILILIAAILIIGRGKGLKAVLGLVYTMFLVVCLLIPSVFSGCSPIAMSILCAVLSTAVTLLLLNGQSRKTYAAIASTTVGMFFALLFFMLMSNMMHIDGYSTSEAEGLLLIQQSTGLRVKEILFAGVLISSLGAIMDVAMSIVSALYELYHHNPQLTGKQLFLSGIEIGKDMIGTMTNTLILAFTGSAFVTLLVFVSYQVQFNQLFHSNYLTIEIAQGICGTFGIVLTVPAASAITAFMLSADRKSHASDV